MKKTLTLVLAVLFVAGAWAFRPAAKNFSGKIHYTITSDLPANHPAAAMMPQKAIYTINEEMLKMEVEPAMPGSGAYYINSANKTMRMLIDLMGKKYQLILDEQLQENPDDPSTITYLPGSRKIAGYDCKKAVIAAEGDSLEVWYTDKLNIANGGGMWNRLKGFPLEYKMKQQGITMNFVASKIEQRKIDRKELTMPTGYEPVKPEELQAKLMEMQMQQPQDGTIQTD